MTSSIYHFFEDLYQRKSFLVSGKIKPDSFPYKDELLSLKGSKGQFPDLAIRINEDGNQYTGGELIEVKDSTSGYNIASFNSTMPSGAKLIKDIAPRGSKIFKEMVEAENKNRKVKTEDVVFSLEQREVYYLIRGKKKDSIKICLVHGSFFETTSINSTLQSAFEQVIDEAISDTQKHTDIDLEDAKSKIPNLDWKQNHFSSTRRVEKSAISLRFRVMSQVVKEANLLNSSQYPCLKDNTLNFVLPLKIKSNDKVIKIEKSNHKKSLSRAFKNKKLPDEIKNFVMNHNIQKDWQYIVFHCPL